MTVDESIPSRDHRERFFLFLHETHTPTFELLRHFLRRFFDGDLVTAPGQTALAVIGSSSMFLTWFPFFTGPIKDKYAHLSALASPEPYRLALRADHLWLLTMLMSAIGLLTVIKWQSLFPSLSDYRAIGWLPVRARQIFGAKLAALLIVATGAVLILDLLPCVGFTALSSGRWAFNHSIGNQMVALLVAAVAGSYFVFFSLVVIRSFLPVQGLLAAGFLISLVLSFSIGAPFTRTVTHPEIARWLPPVWFLGLCQTMSGDPDPYMQSLSHQALTAMAVAIASTLILYAFRHLPAPPKERRWHGSSFDPLMLFLAKGILGNGPQRMILMGYAGFGIAVTGILHLQIQLICIFILFGLRHLFSIPIELRANWMFRIAEGQGKREWLRVIDRFVLFPGVILLIPKPLFAALYFASMKSSSPPGRRYPSPAPTSLARNPCGC